MKRMSLSIVLLIFGMAVHAQDLSFFMEEFTRTDGTFVERHAILEAVRDSGITDGLGEFYHEALRHFLTRVPEITTSTERDTAERSAVIMAQGIGAAGITEAGPELWQVAYLFDPLRLPTLGHASHVAIVALSQIDARDFIPHIVLRVNQFNAQTFGDHGTRTRVQLVIGGAIQALTTFRDVSGFSPVFFVYVGSYDQVTRDMAYEALPNIADDPSEIIAEIIQHPANNPHVKLRAWRVMVRTNAPDEARARVAATALATGWTFSTANRNFQTNLREMRKGAISVIAQHGIVDPSVYTYLERSYRSNFVSNQPDFEEINLTLLALANSGSEQAVNLLHGFLRDLHVRRRSGPWGNRERQVFEWVVYNIGNTGTQSQEVRLLLMQIQRTGTYTSAEQRMAAAALSALAN